MSPRARRPLLLRILLRLYPADYRERYGAEMAHLFGEERRQAGGGLRFAVRQIVDHLEAAAALRRRGMGRGAMSGIVEELRGAARGLRRAPTFTTFAVITLALGIGATTSVFTLVDRVVLRPLPYEGADRLMRVGMRFGHEPDEVGVASGALLADLLADPGPAELVAGVAGGGAILTGGDDPLRVQLSRVTSAYFRLFGVERGLGRLLVEDDFRGDAPRVVVLGHGFWRERFGADPSVVGTVLGLDGEPHEVVGVLAGDHPAPAGYVGGGDLWVPLPADPEARGSFFIQAVARLRPGATEADMAARVERAGERIYGDAPPNFLAGTGVVPLREYVVGDASSALGRVMAAVLLLLLISCANVASLLLTRATERAREFAVRAALGAGRARLVAQLLAESALLALGGGAVGFGLAAGAVSVFRRTAPGGLPRLAEASVDLRTFGFSLLLATATVVLFGLLPALRASRRRGAGAFGRGETGSRAEARLRGSLVAAETALSVVLVVGAGLLAHDLLRVAREEPGFERAGLLSMVVDLQGRPAGEDPAGTEPFWQELIERAAAVPGVSGAAAISEVPYGPGGMVSIFTPEGHEDVEGGAWISVVPFLGDPVSVLGTRLTAGRGLDASEMDGSASVALVNEAFVRAYWPGESGIGRTVKSGAPEVDDEGSFEVVGVLADLRGRPGVEANPRVYVPFAAEPWRRMEVVVRTDGEAASLAPALRAVVREMDPGLPVMEVRTVESLAHGRMARSRFYTGLFSGFALVALVLAVVGIYGTTAYATRLRTREIGIRMALGARRERVVRRVVAGAGAFLALGVVLGLAGAALGARALADVLLQVEPRDVLTYAGVAGLVLASGLAAAWLPARRATRLDLVRTLREEA